MAVGTTNYPTSLDTVVELIEAANNASTTLDGAIDDTMTTITVASTSSFAASGVIAIDNELISYTAKTATDFTGCTRGFEGTAAASHLTGVDVEQIITARSHNVLASALIAIETKLGTGSTIALNKLATVTASRAMVSDASGYVSASSVTTTQLEALGTAQTANYVFAGPAAAPSAAPTFRALVANDIPNLSSVYQPLDADLTAIAALSSDGLLRKTGGTWGMDATSYGTGTVTSVGLSLPAIFNVSNSPVTTSGTLTGALADQNANVIFAGPSTGAATAPTFRSLVAADIPGVLSVTKLSNLTSNGFVKTGSGDGTLSVDTSTYLTANQTITLSGDVTGSGTTSITATIASAAVTYAKIQNVSATSRILGRKTAGAGSTEECTLSEILDFVGSAAQGDILFRGASGWTRLGAGTNGHYLQTQGAGANPQWAAAAGGSGLTIGTTAITSGTAGRILYETSGNVVGEIAGSSADANGAVQFAASARTSGMAQYFRVNTPADTGLTAATWAPGIFIGGDGSGSTVTRQFTGGGSWTGIYQSEVVIPAPTYSATSATTIRNVATLEVRKPIAGSNVTFTYPHWAILTNGTITTMDASAIGGAAVTHGFLSITDSTGASVKLHCSTNPQITYSNNAGTGLYITRDTFTNVIASTLWGVVATAWFDNNGLVGINKITTLAAQLDIVSGSASRVGLRVDSASNSTVALAQYYLNADDTNTPALHSVFAVNSNGTAAAGFGGQLLFQAESSTTNSQDSAAINWVWTTATHASRTAKLQFQLVGNAAALATVAEFDMDTTAGNTRFLIYDVDNATLERVSVGAADSGGTGYKVLRIPN